MGGEAQVFVAGGGLGFAGTTALAMEWDRATWTEVDTAASTQTLWWTWGASADDVWFAGEDGARPEVGTARR